MKYTEIVKTLLVSGTLWSGHEGETHYAILNETEPQTFDEVRKLAGDFQDVNRASVVTVTKRVEEKHRTVNP